MLPPHHAREHHHAHQSDSDFFKGVVIGAVAGAALLWLFGTESGKKVKKQLEDQSGGLIGKIRSDIEEEIFDEEEPGEILPVSVSSPVVKKSSPPKPTKRFFRHNK